MNINHDRLLVISLDGAEEGYKQVVAQLAKNLIDGSMTEIGFHTAFLNALTRFKQVYGDITPVVDGLP